VRANALALVLTAITAALATLLFATERRLGLDQRVSTRYRFHAIPVALSMLYHHQPHDYTAIRPLAMRFQDPARALDDEIRDSIHVNYADDEGRYFWVADDRGLADFVLASFALFGPHVSSLSDFLLALLVLTLVLYTLGYWRTPAALLLPITVLFGWLALAQVLIDRLPFPNAQGCWGEEVALTESRMFDVLALVSVLHLAILAGSRIPLTPFAWATAIPQVALLLFLYHARSSLGWQYLALFSIVALRVARWGVQRIRHVDHTPLQTLNRPLLVGLVLGISLFGLKQYQHWVYHRHYTQEYGQRTFWHNALMGLAFHPALRMELPMAYCDDRNAVDLVLGRMAEADPALDRNQWNWQAALNSLGNHNRFDWNRYESTARSIYFTVWRDHPGEMVECYALHKPLAVWRQVRLIASRLARGLVRGRMPELFIGLIVVSLALGAITVMSRRDPPLRNQMQSLARLMGILIPFSLIPGLAFYPAVTTVACFMLLAVSLAGFGTVLIATRIVPPPR